MRWLGTMAVLVLLSGCLSMLTSDSDPVECSHEFCVSNDRTVASFPDAQVLVNATLPFVQLSASDQQVTWSTPDIYAGRPVAFFSYDLLGRSLYEYPLASDEMLTSSWSHGSRVVFAIQEGEECDSSHASLHVMDMDDRRDRVLRVPETSRPIQMDFDGNYVLVGACDVDQTWVLDLGTGTTTEVPTGDVIPALRDGSAYSFWPRWNPGRKGIEPDWFEVSETILSTNETVYTPIDAMEITWIKPVKQGMAVATDEEILLVTDTSERPYIGATAPEMRYGFAALDSGTALVMQEDSDGEPYLSWVSTRHEAQRVDLPPEWYPTAVASNGESAFAGVFHFKRSGQPVTVLLQLEAPF